jgi:probable HAF family extracellular repeat protein
LLLACVIVIAGCREGDGSAGRASGGRGTFTALGVLAGDLSSEAAGVSSDGRVVVGTSTSAAGIRRAFRWSAAQGMTSVGFLPGGTFSAAKGVSADGSVMAIDADQGGSPAMRAARWTVDLGIVAIPPLRDSPLCAAAAVSSDGEVVVGTCAAPASEAFRWTAQSGTEGLGRLGTGSNASSSATAVSGDGRVVGGSGHPVLTGAVIWTGDAEPTTIGGLPGDSGGTVTALSSDGRTAGGVSRNAQGGIRAFRWTASRGVASLDATDASNATYAAGISGDAQRIVGWTTAASQTDAAVVWDSNGGVHALGDLLAPDARAAFERWSQTRARAVSSDGRTLTGDGVNPGGQREAWLIQLAD